jgi:molybdopterin molybdotransferase
VLPAETVPLSEAAGRVLAEDGGRDARPAALRGLGHGRLRGAAEDARPGARLAVVGEAPAGRAWAGSIGPGEAVRIFTGAPVPAGADRVVIQEDVDREGAAITARPTGSTRRRTSGPRAATSCARARGSRRRGASRPPIVALAAAMNAAAPVGARRPVVALIATGDELVLPGEAPRPDQIVASNIYGLKALVEAEGGSARLLPIARDTGRASRRCWASPQVRT